MKNAEDIKSEFQKTHDMLTEQLERAIAEEKTEFAESLRTSIWTVEFLAGNIGVEIVDNFNPLA